MKWSEFFLVVVGIYVLYYLIIFVLDVIKSKQLAIADPNQQSIEVTGIVLEDNIPIDVNAKPALQTTQNIRENGSQKVAKTVAKTSNVETPFAQTAPLISPVISQGVDLKGILDLAKNGAINYVQEIAF